MFVCLSQARTCISSVLVFFYVQWFQVRGDCLFCWYWWNCWSSLYKLSFHNVFTSGNQHNLFHKKQKLALTLRDRRGRDHMVVGFTTTYAIKARCTTLWDKVCQWLSTGQRFPPPIKLSATKLKYCWKCC